MRISVIGCGYLGAVHAASMAELGHDVVGIDVDAGQDRGAVAGAGARSTSRASRSCWPASLATGRLRFTTDFADARAAPQVHFVCVGTPQKRGEYAADLRYVEAAIDVAARASSRRATWWSASRPCRSGTAARLAEQRRRARRPAPCWPGTPSSCARASPSQDTLHPDRLVYGLPAGAPTATPPARCSTRSTRRSSAAGTPQVVTDYATAELVKMAANSFLATKISFINAMAELCEATGADVTQLADAIGYDDRIGRKFLNAGLGFGGGCLPKDIRAFMARAGELGADQALTFLREVDNDQHAPPRSAWSSWPARSATARSLGKRIAVLGAAFKPDSDDIRDSPALNVAAQLQLQGAVVRVTDPAAIENARRRWPAAGLRRHRRRRRSSAPTPSCCSPSGRSTASSTRWTFGKRASRRSACSTAATPSTRTPGGRRLDLPRPGPALTSASAGNSRMPAFLARLVDRWPLVGRLVKFGSVGFVAYVVDVTIFNVLLYVGAPPLLEGRPLIAKIISTFAATVVAWLGNRYWTFSTRRSDRPVREFFLFALSCTVGLGRRPGAALDLPLHSRLHLPARRQHRRQRHRTGDGNRRSASSPTAWSSSPPDGVGAPAPRRRASSPEPVETTPNVASPR